MINNIGGVIMNAVTNMSGLFFDHQAFIRSPM